MKKIEVVDNQIQEKEEEIKNFFEAIEKLAQLDLEDQNRDLVKRAVAAIWYNLSSE